MTAYIAGWSTTETPMAVVIGGTWSGGVTVPADLFVSHVALGDGGIDGEADYVGFAPTLKQALEDVMTGPVVEFSAVTQRYTISAGSTFSLTFTGTAGENLRRALGFAGDRAAATSHVSDVTPYYLIEQAIGARSEYQGPREPDDLGNESVDDGGRGFGVFRESDEILDHWTQQCETKPAVFTHAATASVPWTWQAFFKHCRMTHPFAVHDGVADANDGPHVYRLRAEGAAFTEDIVTPMEAGVDLLWNVALKARDLGVLP